MIETELVILGSCTELVSTATRNIFGLEPADYAQKASELVSEWLGNLDFAIERGLHVDGRLIVTNVEHLEASWFASLSPHDISALDFCEPTSAEIVRCESRQVWQQLVSALVGCGYASLFELISSNKIAVQ